jgi:uncharacterized damage-inducible protein DinB
MQRTRIMAVVLVTTLALLAPLAAQEKPVEGAMKMPKGFRGEFLAQLKGVEEKFMGLASAMPEEKYGWRPGEGVRSVSEVFMHVSGTNYFIPTFIGVKAPEGNSPDMEKTVTEKTKVLEAMKKSFEYMRQVALKVSDADLDKPAEWFGDKTTVRGVLLNAGLHMHEHLGQSIAYARMNGVVPPWTAAQNAKEQQKKKE